jgi:hypothetical protein
MPNAEAVTHGYNPTPFPLMLTDGTATTAPNRATLAPLTVPLDMCVASSWELPPGGPYAGPDADPNWAGLDLVATNNSHPYYTGWDYGVGSGQSVVTMNYKIDYPTITTTNASNYVYYYNLGNYEYTPAEASVVNVKYNYQNYMQQYQNMMVQNYQNYVGNVIVTNDYVCTPDQVNWQYVNVSPAYHESEEQKATRLAAQQLREEEEKAAETRAEDLLIALLTDAQILQYQMHGYFETEVNDKIYRIKKGRSGNVELIEEGKPKFRYCAHPSEWTPNQDVMISQLLMLKTDEARFLKTANRTVLYQPAVAQAMAALDRL